MAFNPDICDQVITIRVSRTEKRRIESIAQRRSTTVSQWARAKLGIKQANPEFQRRQGNRSHGE